MRKKNENDLEKIALNAIRYYFNDQSYSQSQCKRNMHGLIDEIEILISTLKDDE